MATEISLDEMFGEVPQGGRPTDVKPQPNLATISLGDMGMEVDNPTAAADKGFFERTWENIKEMNEAGKQEFLDNPLRAYYSLPWGAAKSLLGGMLSMGRASAGGLLGIGSMATGGTFDEGPQAVENFLKKDEEFSKGLLYINLAPETKIEEAFNTVLAIIPEGIHAVGETAYDKTGSALVGAGAEGLLTLLSLKPSMAIRPLGAFKNVELGERVTKGTKAAGEKVSSAVEELAVTRPEDVSALAEHVKGADPELGALLDKAVKQAKAKSPEAVGEQVAKDSVPPEPPKPSGPPYKLEDAGNGQLQIVRSDGNWKSQPMDRIAAKSQMEKLIDLAEQNATIRQAAIKTAEAAKGTSVAVEQGMKALAEIPNAPKVELAPGETRESSLRKANEAATEQAKKFLEQDTTEGPTTAGYTPEDIRKGRSNVDGPEDVEDIRMSLDVKNLNDLHKLASGEVTLDDFPAERLAQMKRRFPERFDKAAETSEAVLKAKMEKAGLKYSTFAERTANTDKAFQVISKAGIEPPGFQLAKGKLTEYYDQLIRTVNPEALGPEARTAASTLAKHIAIQMQRESSLVHRAAERKLYWDREIGRDPQAVAKFLSDYEKGIKPKDPTYAAAFDAYHAWNDAIYKVDQALGVKYEPTENYIFHVFKDSRGVAEFFRKKYGAKWGDPGFTKGREFELYGQAKKAGFEPLFDNPEDIMLARQHATDIAQMQVNVLRELEKQGIAVKVDGENRPNSWVSHEWRAPNGERYWVHDSANGVLHNAFNTQSLWAMKGIGGDLFRGAMFLKNAMVPVVLALSLFHPLHVATIANATGMVRASKLLLGGKMSPARFAKEMIEATVYKDLLSETGGQVASAFGASPRGGNRLLKAYQGKLADVDITPSDQLALHLMAEGGFIPEMAAQYRNNSIAKLQQAIARRSATALWHLPFAAISAMQKPVFEVWIPSLKIASYLKDVQTALKADPTLMNDRTKRQVTFRKLAKSVDNRYGEMAYNTLFWNRWVKDLGVANTLSLGWQMGFLREYGGGMLDLARAKDGKVAKGDFDRPMFVTYYTTQALAYGGLLTWALTGQQPQDLNDYIYPRSGETLPNGRPERLNTMFYTREFASIYHHTEKEGLIGGLGHLAASKASGVIGLTAEWARGVNSFGEEIRDPDAPAYKQLEQTLSATMEELQPISIEAIRNSTSDQQAKSMMLNIAGFSPAPKYVTETKTEALITGTFRKYFSHTQTPYERAQFSDDRRNLRKFFDSGDAEKYGDLLDKMQTQYELTGKEVKRLESSIANGADPLVAMFSRLTWKQQKKILDQMTEDEREVYLPASNREHLRYSYEPPEESK